MSKETIRELQREDDSIIVGAIIIFSVALFLISFTIPEYHGKMFFLSISSGGAAAGTLISIINLVSAYFDS